MQNDLGFYSIIEYDVDTPDVQDLFVELFAEVQEKFVAPYPGYISSTFVASIDGKRIYNLVHWASEADFDHFEKVSDAKSRLEAREQVISKLKDKAHFREVGSPRYRVLKTVTPTKNEE
ncbi:antibiotic biosynthesis monooxygenase [Arenibacter sp. M-2]|uniref:antibiotic biosynthesis monooxygenase family protein n=1 Tax=Arenibacter sp. M-2 TaxID=3053612 RepID=UPI002570216D|nr:antibiotic biosynthesis monooxygenase [Arenibacter sp. M-2]MDL5511112.1 antibiotic biosynthesis monooxygenase [Arenibacter sp. M-2]